MNPLLILGIIGGSVYLLNRKVSPGGATPNDPSLAQSTSAQLPPAIWPKTDAQIIADVFAGQTGEPAKALVQATALQALQKGQLFTSENCSGYGPTSSTAQLITSGIGLGGTAAISFGGASALAGALGVGLAPATAGLSLALTGVIDVFGAIFSHHAQKVKQEQQIICAVVQSFNDSASIIEQALKQGKITTQQATASLDQLYNSMQNATQSIIKQDSGHCNAACFILAEARAVIEKKKQTYILNCVPLPCAQAYWAKYPDVAAGGFGPSGGGVPGAPAAYGAWYHYDLQGIKEGRVWPCDNPSIFGGSTTGSLFGELLA